VLLVQVGNPDQLYLIEFPMAELVWCYGDLISEEKKMELETGKECDRLFFQIEGELWLSIPKDVHYYFKELRTHTGAFTKKVITPPMFYKIFMNPTEVTARIEDKLVCAG